MKATTSTSAQGQWKQERLAVRNSHTKMQFRISCLALPSSIKFPLAAPVNQSHLVNKQTVAALFSAED